MSGQPTRAGWRLPLPVAWRGWARFVRRPVPPRRADARVSPTLKTVLTLLGLDLLLMGILLGAVGAAVALGFEMPEHMLGEMALTPTLVGMFVVLLPAFEEVVFRGWLSGRIGHLIGTILALPAMIAVLMAVSPRSPGAATPDFDILYAIAAGFAALALLAVYLGRKRIAPRWYRRHFAWFYWGSALAFAAIHLTNFAAASPSMLPLVLPQFALATLLGYVRVRRGWWSAVLLHMLHNSVFIAAVLAGAAAA